MGIGERTHKPVVPLVDASEHTTTEPLDALVVGLPTDAGLVRLAFQRMETATFPLVAGLAAVLVAPPLVRIPKSVGNLLLGIAVDLIPSPGLSQMIEKNLLETVFRQAGTFHQALEFRRALLAFGHGLGRLPRIGGTQLPVTLEHGAKRGIMEALRESERSFEHLLDVTADAQLQLNDEGGRSGSGRHEKNFTPGSEGLLRSVWRTSRLRRGAFLLRLKSKASCAILCDGKRHGRKCAYGRGRDDRAHSGVRGDAPLVDDRHSAGVGGGGALLSVFRAPFDRLSSVGDHAGRFLRFGRFGLFDRPGRFRRAREELGRGKST